MVKKIFTVKTRYGSFQCVAEPEKDMGGYMVEARTVGGALSWGKTLAETKRKIVEAIEGAIEAHTIARAEEQGAVRITAIPPHPALA